MLSKLSYNKKCWLLCMAFVCILFIAYKISFSNTIALSHELSKKKEKLNWLKEKEKEIPFLRSKMQQMQTQSNDSLPVREKLTAVISAYAESNNCLVTEIPSSSDYKRKNLKIETNTFTLRGNFTNLLKLELKVEEEFKVFTKVVSARFFSKKDSQSKKTELYLTLVTQSFNQLSNSEI